MSLVRTLPLVFVSALIVVEVGCATAAPHVTLDVAPDAAADYDQRAAYYKRAALDGFDGRRMTLHDGTFVYWPEDLKPAVEPTSNTAKAIDDVVAARAALAPGDTIATVGNVVAAGGLATMTGSLLLLIGGTVASNGDVSRVESGFPLFYAGLAGLGLGGVIAMTPSFVFAADYQRLADAAQKVVTTYPQSLSDRVAIQPDANGRLVDLAEGTAGGLGLRGEKDTSVPTL